MTVKLSNQELIEELVGKPQDYPKYASQLINLANQNAQGTRPRVVGQLSELIQECPEKTYEGWKKWYLAKYPNAISEATRKIAKMILGLKNAIDQIDEPMIRRWVEDLVLEKTFVGLRFHEAILKKVASIEKKNYRLSSPSEESQGIDGFIDEIAVSIKPITYKTKNSLREDIKSKIIFYEKTKSGLLIDVKDILEK
ncbi:MAG TPA: MjaI family restriction endonuclease [Patescibacteria group bacterium]|nr:MjaI family restriction endonuclease [Patescibacteria group bacterium]